MGQNRDVYANDSQRSTPAGPAASPSRSATCRPVLVNLWATWCGPCREEMPRLQAAYERFGDRVAFVGVDTQDDPQAAGEFLDEVGLTWPTPTTATSTP